MRDLLLLWLLLCPEEFVAPPGLPDEHVPPPAASAADWVALKQLAYDLELCTPGVESWNDDFPAETRWCRARLREAYDLPPLAWASYLPEHDICKSRHEFAAARLAYLREEWVTAGSEWRQHQRVLDQAERCSVWEWAATATSPTGYTVDRRKALQQLLPYQIAGELPLHVNLCGFSGLE